MSPYSNETEYKHIYHSQQHTLPVQFVLWRTAHLFVLESLNVFVQQRDNM